jgi:TonB family protein
MKTLSIALVLLVGTMSASLGQAKKQLLSKSSEFYQAIGKNVRYPSASSRANNVAKAYVGFNINEQGSIADVVVLNSTNVDSPFSEEIKRVLTKLPAQSQSDAGSYVIPIQFQLETEQKTIQARDENSDFLTSLKDRKILEEVVVVGYAK